MPNGPAPTTRVLPYAPEPGSLSLLDQRRLPHEERWLRCTSAAEVAQAIRSLAVRGAPLIGVAAAWGVAVEGRRALAEGRSLDEALARASDLLVAARPTAVNLPWAVARMRAVAAGTEGRPSIERVGALEEEAGRIAEEDRRACQVIGELGATWLQGRLVGRERATLLTHCNAGALATAGIGTALGVVRALAVRREVEVLADETRPFWQGARLTAWELLRDGIPVTLLPDVAAAGLIASGRVAAVVVGADRIAANGDTANKVGTYGLALACRAAGVPFLVAAPTSTLDPQVADGRSIPIEVRSVEEVLVLEGPGGEPIRFA
ncbi:S-methyl-5-thioribose-1-phosphate isomerase, partial [Acidobacteria bacterium ACD]|nr:S-methyl-5-thioribose-1-phosphate isomerase [Acidobacteria bacterium ACD]